MTFKLKDDQSKDIDIGNTAGIVLTNLTSASIQFYIDFRTTNGKYDPITGEVNLARDKAKSYTRADLGHDHIRIGVRGPDDGQDILLVDY